MGVNRKRIRKNPEIEAEISRRYPKLPLERTCQPEKDKRNELRNLLRIRLTRNAEENKNT